MLREAEQRAESQVVRKGPATRAESETAIATDKDETQEDEDDEDEDGLADGSGVAASGTGNEVSQASMVGCLRYESLAQQVRCLESKTDSPLANSGNSSSHNRMACQARDSTPRH